MTAVRPEVDIDRVMAELDALAGRSDAPAARRHARPLHRRRPGGPGVDQGALRRGRAGGPRGPHRQHLRALGGPRARPARRRRRARTSTRSRTPAGSTARSASWARLEAIRALKRGGFRPTRPIELLMFTSEEPTRFGIGCLGSRALCGTHRGRIAGLAAGRGRARASTRSAAPRVSGASSRRSGSPRGTSPRSWSCTSSKGRSSSARGSRSASSRRSRPRRRCGSTWEGEGGHAGAVLMPGRRDALCAAAEAVLAVEAAAPSSGSPDTVATTGVCRVHPGAINSIPDRVTLEIDVRDIDLGHARPGRRRDPRGRSTRSPSAARSRRPGRAAQRRPARRDGRRRRRGDRRRMRRRWACRACP